ncbi:unnamed protein product [Effrenium voratum]|uniref:Uncharacterized protein n=1 Tax=Effrenium voratum TaxID=2562239 RepID=A0AA36JNK0_9DINO|nr:unnamed protein product [Effrenium voratum]CAJ1408346.1 unnamed protein product [Effrenium voratum]CAJ1428806.1 unnamed protein product [Effrenium voratum]
MARSKGLSFALVVALVLSRAPLLVPRVALRASAEAKSGSGPTPEAWRDFRAQLIAREAQEEAQNRSRHVAPRNEELLRSQSEELWNEYMHGAWAHVAPVEVGGLLCRAPLPAQLTWLMRQGAESFWPQRVREALLKEIPVIEGRSRKEMFETWSKNTMFCYKLADRLTMEALHQLAERSQDIRSLTNADKELIQLYGDMESTWQSVCLVLSAVGDMATEAVTLNRPFARSLDTRLARLLLFGESQTGASVKEQTLLERSLQAFGEAAVYFGGPQGLNQPGVLVHGFSDIEGAEEIAPGTRIYRGGVEAAIEGIIDGRYAPLDFRWFIGRHENLTTQRAAWIPVACARPVALKQCLGLPKPLWHEVLELCGGEHAELSKVELQKRGDVKDDEPE